MRKISWQYRLLDKASRAGKRAYAPYSKFRVGAALLTSGGRVMTGVNVENASYGLTLCAERAALAAAVTAGFRRFKAIAICVKGGRKAVPCGACLQALAEFCGPDFPVITGNADYPERMQVYQLRDLLPLVFRFRKNKFRHRNFKVVHYVLKVGTDSLVGPSSGRTAG